MRDPSSTGDDAFLRDAQPRLLRYARSIVFDDERARDVVQDAIYRYLERREGIEEERALSWLFRTCRNRAIDLARKEKRMDRSGPLDVEQLASPVAEPSTPLEARETARELEAALGILSDNQREVVRLRFQGGLNYRQIAEVCELSVSNVGVLLHEALKNLRGRLASQGVPAGRGRRKS